MTEKELTDEQIVNGLAEITPQSKPFYLEQRIFGAKWARDFLSTHTREVAEKAVDEALDVVFKDCIITDIATDCVEQSGKQFLKDKILARLFPPSKP